MPDNVEGNCDETFKLNEDRSSELPFKRSLIKSEKINIKENLKQL